MSMLPPALVGAVTAPPLAISLTAVLLGGLSGAIFAVQRKFAITGVLAIAIATGLGAAASSATSCSAACRRRSRTRGTSRSSARRPSSASSSPLSSTAAGCCSLAREGSAPDKVATESVTIGVVWLRTPALRSGSRPAPAGQ